MLHRLLRLIRPRLTIEASRVQRLGTSGEDIEAFQKILNDRGERYGVRVDVSGVYDLDTVNAVAKFQRTALSVLNADGFVGPQTSRVLRIRLVNDS